jgi:hypothetical protein
MSTDIFFKYIDIVGTMQLSSGEKTWRGLDKSRIEQSPIPIPSDNDLYYAEKTIKEIIKYKKDDNQEKANNLQIDLNRFFKIKLNL